MSTTHTFRLQHTLRSAVSAFVIAVTAVPTLAIASSLPLWDINMPQGQWRTFGSGVLDTRVLENPPGLSIQVDWSKATFGTGLAYEPRDSGTSFPTLPATGRISFEARIQSDDGSSSLVEPRAEWVARNVDTRERVAPLQLKTTDTHDEGWMKFEFVFGTNTPEFSKYLTEWNALRLIFPKGDLSGSGRLEVRNVELHTN